MSEWQVGKLSDPAVLSTLRKTYCFFLLREFGSGVSLELAPISSLMTVRSLYALTSWNAKKWNKQEMIAMFVAWKFALSARIGEM